MGTSAAYLATTTLREPSQFTPEMSRRARGVELWAVLRSLGRRGLADLIERTCAHARSFADGLRARGFDVLNDVVINQVLVSFGTDEATRAVIDQIQRDGICWCGGTEWHNRAAMRISVSSWATTADDVEVSLTAIERAAQRVRTSPGERRRAADRKVKIAPCLQLRVLFVLRLGQKRACYNRRSRKAFVITESELSVMAALAQMGLTCHPTNGYRTPAASGTPTAL